MAPREERLLVFMGAPRRRGQWCVRSERRAEDAQWSISHTVFNCGLKRGGRRRRRGGRGESTTRKPRRRSLLLGEKAEGGDGDSVSPETAQTVAGGRERSTAIPTVGSGARMLLVLLRTRRRCGHTAGWWWRWRGSCRTWARREPSEPRRGKVSRVAGGGVQTCQWCWRMEARGGGQSVMKRPPYVRLILYCQPVWLRHIANYYCSRCPT